MKREILRFAQDDRCLLMIIALVFMPLNVWAEELSCEVMTVEGSVSVTDAEGAKRSLAEGDLVGEGETVKAGSGAYVDLAFDKEFNNVARVEEGSTATVESVYPSELRLEEGGIFAKLKQLPKDSSFEVTTPTAIAAARGTEYRTVYKEGETEVFNFSESDVYVSGRDEQGNAQGAPMVIQREQKTRVNLAERKPRPVERMSEAENRRGQDFRQGIERNVNGNIARGRVGKIHDVRQAEKIFQERRQQGFPERKQKPGNIPNRGAKATGGVEKRLIEVPGQVPREFYKRDGEGPGRHRELGVGQQGQPGQPGRKPEQARKEGGQPGARRDDRKN